MNKEPNKFPGRWFGDGISYDGLPSYDDIRNHDYEPDTYVSQPMMKLISRVQPDKIPLMEILPTIEGEGMYIGHPRTLMRVGGCAVGCTWCFPGNVPVITSAGKRYIRDVKPNSVVYAKVNGNVVPVTVKNVTVQEVFVSDLCVVSFFCSNQKNVFYLDSVVCTREHPFAVKDDSEQGYKFVKAEDLTNKDVLVGTQANLIDNSEAIVDSVNFDLDPATLNTIGAVNRTCVVYNLECEPHSAYLIGTVPGTTILVHNCDTKLSWGLKTSKIHPIEDAVALVLEQNTAREISITGGEPMHYPLQVAKMCDMYHDAGLKVNLETSGLILNYRLFEKFDFIGLDIKTPSSGVTLTAKNIGMILECALWHPGLQLKAVISSMDDLDFVMKHFGQIILDKTGRFNPLVFTPCADTTNEPASPKALHATTQMIREWDKGYNIRIIPQIHKLLNFA